MQAVPISPLWHRRGHLCTVCAPQYVHLVRPPLLIPCLHIAYSLCAPDIFTNYVVLPPDLPGATFPPDLRTPTLGLASSHLICSVALTGVLALQTGRWWAERADDDASTAQALSTSGRGGGEKEDGKSGCTISSQSGVTVGQAGAST
jgi:hypothetical protein